MTMTMMKSSISYCALTLLAINILVSAQTEPPVSCSAFSLKFDCTYKDDIAIPCSDEDMDRIGNVAHAIVQLDIILSQLGSDAPPFDVAYEIFGNNVTVDHTGLLAPKPDPVEVEQNLSPQDVIQQLIYEGSATPTQGPTTAGPVGVPTTAAPVAVPTTAAPVTDPPTVAPSTAAPITSSPTPINDVGRRLEEANVDAVEGKNDWQPFGTYEHHHEGNRRFLPGDIDCGRLKTCKASWCCMMCGMNCRRRRLTWKELSNIDERSKASLRGRELSDYETEKALYLEKVRMMEERVSKMLEEKLRYLALSEAIQCLGNHWELKIDFSTNLADIYPGPDVQR